MAAAGLPERHPPRTRDAVAAGGGGGSADPRRHGEGHRTALEARPRKEPGQRRPPAPGGEIGGEIGGSGCGGGDPPGSSSPEVLRRRRRGLRRPKDRPRVGENDETLLAAAVLRRFLRRRRRVDGGHGRVEEAPSSPTTTVEEECILGEECILRKIRFGDKLGAFSPLPSGISRPNRPRDEECILVERRTYSRKGMHSQMLLPRLKLGVFFLSGFLLQTVTWCGMHSR